MEEILLPGSPLVDFAMASWLLTTLVSLRALAIGYNMQLYDSFFVTCGRMQQICFACISTYYIRFGAASMLGLPAKTVPYLQIKRNRRGKLPQKHLELGVSFASASSGFYDSTAKHFVSSRRPYLDNFGM